LILKPGGAEWQGNDCQGNKSLALVQRLGWGQGWSSAALRAMEDKAGSGFDLAWPPGVFGQEKLNRRAGRKRRCFFAACEGGAIPSIQCNPSTKFMSSVPSTKSIPSEHPPACSVQRPWIVWLWRGKPAFAWLPPSSRLLRGFRRRAARYGETRWRDKLAGGSGKAALARAHSKTCRHLGCAL